VRYTIRRTFLTRSVQTYAVDMPDEVDPQHLIVDHFSEFDTDLCAGGDPLNGWSAALVGEKQEVVDYDELGLEIVERHWAKVIPMRRKS
jgi:hypothetical protein